MKVHIDIRFRYVSETIFIYDKMKPNVKALHLPVYW